RDPRGEIIARILPVTCGALMIVAIFYFFSRYSLWLGFYSLFLSLSSSMWWRYWVEARPYSLWMFLTAIQMLLFIYILEKENEAPRAWRWLLVTHWLLSLTVIFSLVQIVAVSFLLWIWHDRRVFNWRKYLFLTILPCLMCLFYYSQAPKYQFWIMFSLEQIIRAHIPRYWLYVFYLIVLFLSLFICQRKTGWPLLYRNDQWRRGIPYFFLMAIMLLATALVVGIFHVGQSPQGVGFPLTEKYFINLVPMGIIGITWLSYHVLSSLRGIRWLQFLVILGIAIFLGNHVTKVIPDIQGHHPEVLRKVGT
ncbi:MAG: hypothetical protein NUV91_00405, partial [Candidatus Omnitrophica bacterium]|nr:hypothetical protein [Candidatus Omnitrophota bacterium]